MAIKEAYPNLKADQETMRLMEELTSSENRVALPGRPTTMRS